MSIAATAHAARIPPTGRWLSRIRLLLGAALVWLPLHYLIDRTLLARGLDRPVTIAVGDGGVVAVLAVGFVLVLAGLAGAFVAGRPDARGTVLVCALGLLGWAMTGGTMDDWLVLRRPEPGPGTADAYRALFVEYAAAAGVLALAGLGGLFVAARRHSRTAGAELRALLDEPGPRAGAGRGLAALLGCAAVAAVLIELLGGPRYAWTLRGQVLFSVGVGFIGGTLAAVRLTHVRSIGWYAAAPLLVGLAGLLHAAVRPALVVPYDAINILPVSNLVRPLPIEMLTMGLITIHWTLAFVRRASGGEARRPEG